MNNYHQVNFEDYRSLPTEEIRREMVSREIVSEVRNETKK